MKKIIVLAVFGLTVCAAAFAARPQAAAPPASFAADFLDKAMRLDLYHVGDAREELITVDQIYQEPVWPGTFTKLIDPYDCGRYVLKVFDVASNRLLFAEGCDDMYSEYRTTTPAINGVKRVFQRSVRFPYPKRPVLAVIEARDKKNVLYPVFSQTIDPADYHIVREPVAAGDQVIDVLVSGDPHDKVDFVFLAEGYTAEDRDKFKADVARMTDFLFGIEPYKSARNKVNVRAVFRPSPERAMDEPRQNAYRQTVLDASFNAFDLDRYMLIEQDHRMHRMAAQAPYDAIIILVNSKRYGGGSIALDYCVSTVDNERSKQVFVHELAHSFGFIGDEYYTSEVSYNDFYPKGVEPLEPNITALLDPSQLKWKDLLSPGIGIPTEYGKDKIEAAEAERQKNRKARADELAAAKAKGSGEAEVKAIQDKWTAADQVLNKAIADVRAQYAGLADKVGVFEGAGYASKGLYRSQINCLMISNVKDEFCAACRRGIGRMIDWYSRAN